MANVSAILDHHAAVRPARTALIWRGGQRTYAELHARVNALAAMLTARGIGQGDRVAIVMQNRTEFIEAIFAINRIGAAFLPINTRLAPAEWQYILKHSQTAAVLTEASFEPKLADVLPAGSVTVRLSVDEPQTEHFERLGDAVDSYAGAHVPVVDVDSSVLQRLMYTSGTTARPKGVCISHENFAWKNIGMLVQFGWSAAEVTVVAGPLYHVGALDMGGLTTLHAGGTLVLQPKFDAADLLALIEEHRVTNAWLAPAMVSAVLQCPDVDHRDLTSLRLILSGGEKMPETRMQQVLDRLPGIWFADAYGLTETVSSDTFLDRDHMWTKLGSVGRPLPYHQVRVVDTDGAPVAAGTIGEIVVRGPKVFAGYWRDPDATARAIRGGWFHTGDMGYLDADGYLYVEDRKKDMIVSGGENIASPEVERAIYEHPAVVEVAVVGHPDEQWGEVPHAFVVLREGATVGPDELRDFCRDRLAKFKVPRYVDFLTVLPRTPTGKVLKRNLRTELAQESNK